MQGLERAGGDRPGSDARTAREGRAGGGVGRRGAGRGRRLGGRDLGTGARCAGGVRHPRRRSQLLLDGEPYLFTGLNVYNANSRGWCWYDMVSGSVLDDSIVAMGPGTKVIRAWFFQTQATTSGVRDWSAFDHTLAVRSDARGVKVIPTLANQWADCEPSAGYKTRTWYETGYTQPDPGGTVWYRDFVAEIVARYANDPTIMAWQLINEAQVKDSEGGGCSTNAATILRNWASDVSGLVKSIDPDHLVSIGTIGTGQCGASTSEYQTLHTLSTVDLCEFHDYGSPLVPIPGDIWNGMQVRLNQCAALDKPLFVGETGIIPNTVGGTLQARADAFEAKFDAQLAAGVVGELVWTGTRRGRSSTTTTSAPPTRPSASSMHSCPTRSRLAWRSVTRR